ncbi:protein cueball-like, partial [Trichoplusia ni]|uniref:Protein cueball n=1 Tax=Trichoplusia ni TaxID=7111 RepID=A0A7E5WXH4_TRINI
IAVTTGEQLEFYSNNTKIRNEGVRFRDLTALAYDAVHNMLLFVDKQSDNASIFSFNLGTKKYRSLVRRRSDENIQDLTFDPVEGKLFWTDTNERSIFWISMKPGSKNNDYGNLLIKMDDEIPRAIAVDSCRGYIYWTNINVTKPTIERARLDGTNREVVIDTNIYMPVSLAIDQQTKQIYWADDKEGIHYSIETADLDGKNRRTLMVGTHHQPYALTVSKDSIYWVDWGYRSVWQLPKNPPMYSEPEEIKAFNNELPFGVVANYQIEDQTHGNPECENLSSLSQNNSVINDTFYIPTDVGLFCVHGIKVSGKPLCNCTVGYTGERCDISVCQNYCFQGDCSLTSDGQPTCNCNNGYSGNRCEVNVCTGYCLNNGICSLNEKSQPTCQCLGGDHEGERCQTLIVLTTTTEAPPKTETNQSCNCSDSQIINYQPMTLSPEAYPNSETIIEGCSSWDPVRDPVIVVLGILCGLLCLACAVLITKNLQLRRRPRIKKRIIVNKNVTPMTARPDQCEITIENCCNMNICETVD